MDEITKTQSSDQQTTGPIPPDITLDVDLAALLTNVDKFFLRFHQLQQQTKQTREEQELKQQRIKADANVSNVSAGQVEEWSELSRSIQRAMVLLDGDAENKLYERKIRELKATNRQLRKQLDELEHTVSQRCDTDDTKKTIDRLDKEIAELRQQKEFAETEATMGREKLSRSYESSEKQLVELRSGYERIIRKLSDDKAKLREEILELNAKHEALQERLHRLESQSLDFLGGPVPVRAPNSGKRISEVVQFFPKGSDVAPATAGIRQNKKRKKNV